MPNLGLNLLLARRSGPLLDASVFDGGTITLYSGSAETDAGDALGSGTLPAKAFENVDVDGIRAKHGTWAVTLTKNAEAIRGALISSAAATINVWCEVVTGAAVGNQIQIDHADGQIGDVVTLTAMDWDLVSDGDADSVTALSRDAGSAAGGASVDITGTGFTGTPLVFFGATPATDVVVNSATSITCTVPAYGGSVDANEGTAVDVTVADQTLTDGFTYYPTRTTTHLARVTCEDGTIGGLPTDFGTGGSGADSTEQAYSGTHSRKVIKTGTSAGGAKYHHQFADNAPLNETNGIYCRWMQYIPSTSVDAVIGTQRQEKIHLFRTHAGSGQPGFFMIGIGSAFGGREAFVMRDPDTSDLITTGLDPSDQWVEWQIWYTRKGGVGRGRVWVNGRLIKDHSSSLMGNDNTAEDYRWYCGISHVETGGADITVENYIDDLEVANGFIDP